MSHQNLNRHVVTLQKHPISCQWNSELLLNVLQQYLLWSKEPAASLVHYKTHSFSNSRVHLKIDRAQVFLLQCHEKTCEHTEKIGLVYMSVWFLLALVQLHCCWRQDRIFRRARAFKGKRSCMVLCTYLICISGKGLPDCYSLKQRKYF